jgi:hypothetical protein
MGSYYKSANISVALIHFEPEMLKIISSQLTLKGPEDPGHVSVQKYDSISASKNDIESGKITAICLNIERAIPEEITSFVSEVRITKPLIPFCFSASTKTLKAMNGFHPNWKKKFEHYFKVPTDLSESDIEENCGRLRDLFIADFVKCSALGNYETTPGIYSTFKTLGRKEMVFFLVVPLLAAVVGGLVQPVYSTIFDKKKSSEVSSGKATPWDVSAQAKARGNSKPVEKVEKREIEKLRLYVPIPANELEFAILPSGSVWKDPVGELWRKK